MNGSGLFHFLLFTPQNSYCLKYASILFEYMCIAIKEMEKEEENISHFNALTSISANGTSPGNKETSLLSGEVPVADIDVKALK